MPDLWQSVYYQGLDSIYYSTKCSKVAYKRKKDAEKKEALFVAYAQNMPDIREYITAKQVIALYGIERSTLYRLARLGKIPCINLGVRLTRFKRSELDLLFHYRRDLKNAPVVKGKKLYSLEPEDCYTIGEICEKYQLDDSSVWAHVRKYSIPPVKSVTMFMFQKKKLIIYINQKNNEKTFIAH